MTITLRFKGTTAALAGNPFGKEIFNTQVLPYIPSPEENVEIVFPPQIRNVTSSFIQGFFDYWLRTLRDDEIRDRITVKSDNEKVISYIWKNVRREE